MWCPGRLFLPGLCNATAPAKLFLSFVVCTARLLCCLMSSLWLVRSRRLRFLRIRLGCT
uniref:Uncharacterized protein n=1 Tax=Rhizophora mucronata TaxID=61149 RepID=A0A2P2PN79_RHIMU